MAFSSAATIEQPPTLIAAIWPAGRASRLLRLVVLLAASSLLLTISAKVQVPFWPVPLTMQTFVVLVIGMAYGSRLGFAAVLLYLLEGACGLPVFAGTPEKGIGLAYMMGPTGGYLVGFAVAAWILGWLGERGWDRSIARTAVAMTAGHAIILALGVVWLAGLVGWETAVAAGLAPFWTATFLKTALGVAAMPAAWSLVRRARSEDGRGA
jgi:biotin transport system substrate-specific component